MARTKGSLNKSTLAKQVDASKGFDLDKHDNILLGGRKVGTVGYDDGLFIAEVTGRRFGAFDLDEALELAKAALV